MPNDLAEYRVSLGQLLATAIDSATWTTAILDEALRHGLLTYNSAIVYETSFTTIAAGYAHDLSTITQLGDILALAYPWSDGLDYAELTIHWRFYDHHKVYIAPHYAAIGELIRVRHTKRHLIKDLDAAASTTVPTDHRDLLTKAAAAYACLLRARQVTENPALPKEAITHLELLATRYRTDFDQTVRTLRPAHNPAWPLYGLD